jgi:hypothetical protein
LATDRHVKALEEPYDENLTYLTGPDIELIYFNLMNEDLREMYDKHNYIHSQQQYEERRGFIPQQQKYMLAFQNVFAFAPYFILIFFMIDKHVR